MKKIFRAEYPDMLGVPKGDIEVKGLDDMRDMLTPRIENVYIDKRKRRDPVFGRFHYVKAVVLPYYAPNCYSIIGITNFYEE